jgi:transcriptional regulator with PAS, ATPase and Fis domain
MPLTMQSKLLRVLESGEVIRLGGNEKRHAERSLRERDQPRPRR